MLTSEIEAAVVHMIYCSRYSKEIDVHQQALS